MKRTKRNIERLIRGATGEIKADLIVSGGEMVNVYFGGGSSDLDISTIINRHL